MEQGAAWTMENAAWACASAQHKEKAASLCRENAFAFWWPEAESNHRLKDLA